MSDQAPATRPQVSLIFTVLNEADTIGELTEALDAQTVQPDEIVVVDGGSTDGTLEHLKKWSANNAQVRVHSLEGANISIGRNFAIHQATGEVIAVTDAGCTPEPQWLEELTSAFKEPAVDLAMGFYKPDARSRFERVSSCLNLPDAKEVNPAKFMPSSRSVAYRKWVWDQAGKYPEWLEVGEDMFFNFSVKHLGATRQFAPKAVVKWRLQPTLKRFRRQYSNYARGDAIGGMYISRHALRFFIYAAAVGLIPFWLYAPWTLVFPAVLGAVWLRGAYRRAFSRLSGSELLMAIPALPALQAVQDVAKMGGYLKGVFGKKPRLY